MTWKPIAKTETMLDFGMAKIKNVPYPVNSRWLFYRILQAGLVPNKSYITKFDYAFARARKEFYGEWKPDTLIDTIRRCNWGGEYDVGYTVQFDSIEEQEVYLQCWFEAEAMYGQFAHYTKPYRVSLIPFRGDLSIPMKWKLAKKIEAIGQNYNKPIQILYFGDYDKKGFQIIESAIRDIKAWCNTDFNIERIGLTLEQVKEFNLPENPDHPNAYQWEALEENQAGKLIIDALDRYVKPVDQSIIERENVVKKETETAINWILKQHGEA